MVLGQDFEPPQIRSSPPDPKVLEAIVGTYQFGPEFYRPNASSTFVVQDGRLFYGGSWMMPTAADEWTFVHRQYWAKLVFVRDDSGRVTELQFDQFVGLRIREGE